MAMKYPSAKDNDERMKRVEHCQSCLDWHGFCDAECCKHFIIPVNGTVHKGKLLVYNCGNLLPDMMRYYDLHGCPVKHGLLQVPAACATQEGSHYVVGLRCRLLTPDNKCSQHPLGKPLVCRELTMESVRDQTNRFGVCTPNCRFLYAIKLEAEKHDESERIEKETG